MSDYRPLNSSGRSDTYEWVLEPGELTILSHCCGDHFDEAEMRVLFGALKEYFDDEH